MRFKIKSILLAIAIIIGSQFVATTSSFALLDDHGGYHIRFIHARTCLAAGYDKYHSLEAKSCRALDDDPRGIYDPFGPFLVLMHIRNHDDHKWVEARLTNDCMSATQPVHRRPPFADMCRPGSLDQKWELLGDSDNHYRLQHVSSKLCLGHTFKDRYVSLLPCTDERTRLAITLHDPYPLTDLPPWPTPNEG